MKTNITKILCVVVGERKCHAGFDTSILAPGSGKNVAPSGTYMVWDGAKFGTASAFIKKLRDGTFDWDSREHVCW